MKISALFGKGVTAFILMGLALSSTAEVNDKAPKPIIEFTTSQIMTIIDDAPEYFDEDPDRFYREIGEVLDATIDWRGFAKGVMGEYASNARYKRLDAEGKKALREQLETFTGPMQQQRRLRRWAQCQTRWADVPDPPLYP